ncbi:33089_t:CDS:2 [Gigaspora margarita]|uniref:33089_t:CDS:1 n=1 Tax=Gigaspora margarita TaxID=4874 RepID=A0ABN7V0T9_GIGMA|nr:33089_t:CDS:2 [Gigaspora margarita]
MTFTEVKKSYNISDNDLASEVSNNFNLFDSDKEYNNNEKPILAINLIFEDESERERLNLQKKFRGDTRFKLTAILLVMMKIMIPMNNNW